MIVRVAASPECSKLPRDLPVGAFADGAWSAGARDLAQLQDVPVRYAVAMDASPRTGPFGTSIPATPRSNALSEHGGLPAEACAAHEQWLLELTSLPTAAGREHHVIAWIERWVAARSDLTLTRDEAGNLVLSAARSALTERDEAPLFITAHLDHPAFVVESIGADGAVELTFRGSVRDPYFVDAQIVIHASSGERITAAVTHAAPAKPLRACRATAHASLEGVRAGDVATWMLPDAVVRDGLLYAPACDDLAGVAAALAALDVLRTCGTATDVRVLLTRAEEVGFIGAIRACRLGTMPPGSRVLALENSRSYADSPIGGGPIVRVGDRLSTFDPDLTRGVAQIAAEEAVQDAAFRWQRKLMPGGACEATAFCAFGFASTCLCLPLGNYHNMADLETVERTDPAKASVGPEVISIEDFHGLVRMLVGCGARLSTAEPIMHLLDRLEEERCFVLEP